VAVIPGASSSSSSASGSGASGFSGSAAQFPHCHSKRHLRRLRAVGQVVGQLPRRAQAAPVGAASLEAVERGTVRTSTQTHVD